MCVFSVGSEVSQGRQGLRESTVADLSVRGGCSRSFVVCVCVCVCLRRAWIVPPIGREGERVKPAPSVSMELPFLCVCICVLCLSRGPVEGTIVDILKARS